MQCELSLKKVRPVFSRFELARTVSTPWITGRKLLWKPRTCASPELSAQVWSQSVAGVGVRAAMRSAAMHLHPRTLTLKLPPAQRRALLWRLHRQIPGFHSTNVPLRVVEHYRARPRAGGLRPLHGREPHPLARARTRVPRVIRRAVPRAESRAELRLRYARQHPLAGQHPHPLAGQHPLVCWWPIAVVARVVSARETSSCVWKRARQPLAS